MEARLNPLDLHGALTALGKIVPKRHPHPALGCVSVSIDDGAQYATLRGTDLEAEFSITLEALSGSTPGTALFPFRELAALVKGYKGTRKTPGPVLTLTDAGGPALLATQDRIPFASVPDVDAFPERVELAGSCPPTYPQAGALARLLSSVAHAMSADETRYHLNGIYLEPTADGLTAVAADGYRLTTHTAPGLVLQLPAPSIFPRIAVPALLDVLACAREGTVEIEASLRELRIETPGRRLIVRWVDGTFPEWRRVLPRSGAPSVTVRRKELAEAIKAVQVVQGKDKMRGVRLSVADGTMTVLCRSKEAAELTRTVSIVGPDREMPPTGYNVRYLLDALSSSDAETVTWASKEPASQGTFTSDGEALCIVMPMRL